MKIKLKNGEEQIVEAFSYGNETIDGEQWLCFYGRPNKINIVHKVLAEDVEYVEQE